MNFLKRLAELASIRLSTLAPRQLRYDISRKDWIDFCLFVAICFLIVIYKINKT